MIVLDFRAFAKAHRIPVLDGQGHHHCKEGWVQIHCPLCSGGRHGWHLGFSTESGAFNCWRCGRLRFLTVISTLLRCSEGTAREKIRDYLTDRKQTARIPKIRKRNISPPMGTGPLLPPHRRYLKSRGFNPEHLQTEWGILGTGPISNPGWAWRILLPIREPDGQTVAYQGRTIGDGDPRYKMTDEDECLDDPEGFLYGIDKLRGKSVLIVEGGPGVWRIGPGTVATLGIDWKKKQANRLRRFPNRYILFDPETKAQQRAEQLANHLSLFSGTVEILSGHATDPGEFTEARARKIRRMLAL